MKSSSQQIPPILAHWTYTRDEWKTFTRWTKRRKGFFHYMFHSIFPKSLTMIPQVIITTQQVWVGVNERPFNDNAHWLRRIDIRDEGKLNILEISYTSISGSPLAEYGIHVPVPKGKLREAVSVHSQLTQES